MGIIPVDSTFNDHCPRCWPYNSTPELLKCFIGGIVYDPVRFPGLNAAPNEYVDLHQTIIGCEWVGYGTKAWRVVLQLFATESTLTVESDDDVFAFASSPQEICIFHPTNAFQNPLIFAYTGGWAFISTPAKIQAMIQKVTPITGPDPRMELFPKADGHVVLRLANIQSGTNIEINIDTALL